MEHAPSLRTHQGIWWVIAAMVLLIFTVALGFAWPSGNGEPVHSLMLVPGVLAAALTLAIGAAQDLLVLRERWVPPAPGEKEFESALVEDKPAFAPPTPPITPSPPMAPSGLPRGNEIPVVHLGPGANCAFAQWRFFWEIPDGRRGVVLLPMGRTVLLGRHEDADIVVDLSNISREHLLLNVRREEVRVMDPGSSAGTLISLHNRPWEPMVCGETYALNHGTRLQLGDPILITLTLEPNT